MAAPAKQYLTSSYNLGLQWWPGLAAIATLLIAGIAGGGLLVIDMFGGSAGASQLGQFILAGMQVIPFALLALLAYFGVRQPAALVIAFIWLALVLMAVAGFSVLFAFGVLVAASGALQTSPAAPQPIDQLLPPGSGGYLTAVSLWSLLGLIVAGLALLPGVRRMLARILPFDPRSWVHAIALSAVTGLTIISFGQLIAAGGTPPLLEMVETMPDAMEQAGNSNELLLTLYGFAWMLPAGLMAVGFPVVRGFGEALRRLGFVRPTAKQVGVAIGLALLLVAGVWVLDIVVAWIWEAMGWELTDAEAFEQLLGNAISPIGAVVIGVTAGVGEEMVVRGALQPRLGILLSNLFFTSLHAFQYGFDALLTVFLIGMVLGLVRARSNTTAAAIVHGVYNFTSVMLSLL